MLIALDDARERIKPIESMLIDAFETATRMWARLVREQPDMALPLDSTARAKFIACHACHALEPSVASMPGVEVNDQLGFFALRLPPDVLLRLKYVGNTDGAPHNYPTRQQVLLSRQTYDENMLMALGGDDAFTAPTLLTCGYTLDELDIGRIEIRCDCAGRLSWAYDIFGGDALMEPLTFPDVPRDPKPARVASSRRVQRKDDRQAQSG
jgi:hypothetical protein